MKNLIHFALCFTLFVAFRNEEIVKFVGGNKQWLSDVKELGDIMDNSEVEEYRDAVGFEEYFQVSNMGNIYSKRSNRIVKQSTSGAGYKIFTTKVNGISMNERVHRMVAMAFLPNELNKPYVNHKDGCKTNNILSNLEWVTHAENVTHAWATGLQLPRPKHSQRKLTADQVLEIRASTKSYRELSSIYGLSQSSIGGIKRRETYKDIPDWPAKPLMD